MCTGKLGSCAAPLGQALRRLLAIEIFSDAAFGRSLPRRWWDYVVRLVEVLRARVTRYNPPIPPWWRRETARWPSAPGRATAPGGGDPPLLAVAAVWNEDDVIYATVAHALSQGVDRIFVLDDSSDDDTVTEAQAAGAVVETLPTTTVYDEAVRTLAIQELVVEQTIAAGGDAWWLILDADELPCGPSTLTIRQLVEMLPDSIDVVGSRVLDHVPSSMTRYQRRQHPLASFPLAYWHATPYCPAGHWKHQLLRRRTSRPLLPLPGHHVVGAPAETPLCESAESLLLHHFPLRDRATMTAKFDMLAQPDSRYGRSPDAVTHTRLAQRRRALELHYSDRHDLVPHGLPGHRSSGIQPVDWRELVPESERASFPPNLARGRHPHRPLTHPTGSWL